MGIGRRLIGQVVVVLALAASAGVFLAYTATRHGFFDLDVYHGAITYWAHGHGEIYDYLRPRSRYGFTYPPFAALTMLPMAVLSWHVTIVVATTATVLATLAVLDWLLAPLYRRYRWPRGFVVAVAAIFAGVFEPLRETVLFGQVNMLLVFLVFADLVLLARRGSRLAGMGIGLATAIKLTPGVFLLYLLVARKWRAAAVASGTAAGATLLAAAVAPHASLIFWTDALWDTGRVGQLDFISNQSLQGFVARLDPGHPSRPLWIGLVLVVLALWAWRVRSATRAGDDVAAMALTGVLGCLVSPVTWVHHLVWALPALVLLVSRALQAPTGRRPSGRLALGVGLYVLLSSKLVWNFSSHFGGWGLLGANAYVWASVVLLVALPLRRAGTPDVPEFGDLDHATARTPDRVARASAVGGEPGAGVEPARTVVAFQDP